MLELGGRLLTLRALPSPLQDCEDPLTGIAAELEAAGATIKYSIDAAHLRQTLQVGATLCCITCCLQAFSDSFGDSKCQSDWLQATCTCTYTAPDEVGLMADLAFAAAGQLLCGLRAAGQLLCRLRDVRMRFSASALAAAQEHTKLICTKSVYLRTVTFCRGIRSMAALGTMSSILTEFASISPTLGWASKIRFMMCTRSTLLKRLLISLSAVSQVVVPAAFT